MYTLDRFVPKKDKCGFNTFMLQIFHALITLTIE